MAWASRFSRRRRECSWTVRPASSTSAASSSRRFGKGSTTMSRIGRLAIKIPAKVKVTAQPGVVNVEGPKGKISQKLDSSMKVVVEKDEVRVERPNEERRSRELHGLSRTLIANMVKGVTDGFSRSLD